LKLLLKRASCTNSAGKLVHRSRVDLVLITFPYGRSADEGWPYAALEESNVVRVLPEIARQNDDPVIIDLSHEPEKPLCLDSTLGIAGQALRDD
jgi:hypothetical protein